MFALLKNLFSALNSAQKPYQVALALSLGLLSGFLPLFTPLNFILLFFVFTLNIPIGLYFASLAAFGFVGYFLDPLFIALGEFILTLDALNGFFTALYNNPFALWTSFNYTGVMGSFVAGSITAFVAFFVFKAFVPKIRAVLERLAAKSKLLAWLNPYSDKKLKKIPGAIRWWGALGFIGIFGGVAALLLLVLDPALKLALEKGVGFVTRTDVKIKDLETKLAELSLEIKGINVYKNDEKTLKIDRIFFAADPKHAAAKKLDVTRLGFANLDLNPAQDPARKKPIGGKDLSAGAAQGGGGAQTAQSAQAPKSAQDLSKKEKSGFAMPSANFPSVDEILAKEGVTSLKELAAIKENSQKIKEKWQEISARDLNSRKIDEFKARFDELKKLKVKDAATLSSALKQASALKDDLNAYKEHIESISKEFKGDEKTLRGYIATAQSLPQAEFAKLVKKYSSLTGGGLNFVSTYISPALSGYLAQGLKYYEKLKPYLKSNAKDEKKDELKRKKGRWVKFKNKSAYPGFYIRKITGNVLAQGVSYDFIAQDITNEQKILNKPATAKLTTQAKVFKNFVVTGLYDTRGKESLIESRARLEDFPRKELLTSNDFAVKKSVLDALGYLRIADLTNLSGDFKVDFKDTKMAIDGMDNKTGEILNSVLDKIKIFSLSGKLGGKIYAPSLDVVSDLDRKIGAAVSSVFDEERAKFEAELKTKLETMLRAELKKANLSDEEMQKIGGALKSKEDFYAALNNELEQRFSKKALEEQLKKETDKLIKKESKKLEDKAKKELKNLLKF